MLDLPRLVAESDIGSIATVEVLRKNKVLSIEVELGELPEKDYVKKNNSENETNVLDLDLSIKSTDNNTGVIVMKNNEASNLLVGDIIIEINRDVITSVKSFIDLIKEIKETGRTSILLKVLRDNKTLWLTMKFKN